MFVVAIRILSRLFETHPGQRSRAIVPFVPGQRSRSVPDLHPTRKRSQISPFRVWWEPPALAGGAGLQSSGNAFYLSRMGFSPGFSRPALKRMIKVELFPATLKRCFPLLKQRAPTKLQGGSAAFRSSHADSLAPEVLLSCPVQTFSAACLVGAVKNGIGL